MFRAILPEGQIDCASYELGSEGIELYTDDEEFIAFVPYANLHALLHESVYEERERSVM